MSKTLRLSARLLRLKSRLLGDSKTLSQSDPTVLVLEIT
eukprot:CAMPEP_0202840998 /NCGR_PEP_ID=MMETSP1389-20130828/57293_1 /ASSEMBLY_ACC=CAM_ASM_000865 /TAXON_ID=302021 /ORGANISM="Rhodomonas sp., Strain CCMP768" /LENGTH=38 /DNA_ID= /DNA_START= /DNA_END= /DNA_ORIENTATION=